MTDTGVGYNPNDNNAEQDFMDEPALRFVAPLVEGRPPAARGGHTSALVNDDTIVLFGGTYFEGDGVFSYCNDVWCLDLGAMTWYQPKIAKGAAPEGRYGHTATLIGKEWFIFGGRGAKGKHFKDMWRLDMSKGTFRWDRVSSATAPPAARMGHAQVLIGDKIVIFGGYDERQTYGDLWVFDSSAMTWLRPRTAGRPPSPRYNHTMELLPDGRIIVFAGYHTVAKKGSEYLQDIRELDTETMVWSRPRVVGEFPEKRMQHRTCMMGRQMVMFGGWTGVKNKDWSNKDDKGGKDGENDGVAKSSKNLLCLDTDSMEWFFPTFGGPEPERLYGHTITRVGTSLFLIGGWDGTRPLNEVVVLEFPPPDDNPEDEVMYNDQ
jgi:host cell factor